MAVVEIYC